MQTETSRLTSGTETQGLTGLNAQPLTDDEHRAMHHRANGTCVFGQCALTETIKAHELRDGDVIVNPSGGGEHIPVLLATRYGDLVMIWTNPDKGFVLSPGLLIEIAKRGGGEDNHDFEAPKGFQHFSGGYCDDPSCANSSPHTYDGHTMWKTAEAYARAHHANGDECSRLVACGSDGCRRAGA